jgi:hypothetical protein
VPGRLRFNFATTFAQLCCAEIDIVQLQKAQFIAGANHATLYELCQNFHNLSNLLLDLKLKSYSDDPAARDVKILVGGRKLSSAEVIVDCGWSLQLYTKKSQAYTWAKEAANQSWDALITKEGV